MDAIETQLINIRGLNLHRDMHKSVIEEGTNFDKYELNKNTDVLIATYPRTGW